MCLNECRNIERIKNYNSKEISDLLEENERLIEFLIYKYAYSISKMWDTHVMTKDDVKQEAYIAIYEALPYYDSNKGKFSTYCKKVIRNRMLKIMRKSSAKKRGGKKDEEGRYKGIDFKRLQKEHINATVYQKENIEDSAIINEEISSLSSKEQDIVNYLIAGYKNKEIAEFYNVNPSTTSRWKKKIEKKLTHID